MRHAVDQKHAIKGRHGDKSRSPGPYCLHESWAEAFEKANACMKNQYPLLYLTGSHCLVGISENMGGGGDGRLLPVTEGAFIQPLKLAFQLNKRTLDELP